MMEEIDVVSTACPQGQFSTPAYCDADAYNIHAGRGASQHRQQPGSSLLEQLQDCNCRAQRLLTLLSIHREQGIAAHAGGVDRLFSEALACILHALQAAAAAKQPLLTASSQHSSCFCKLLERLHLLDALWKASNPGPTLGMQEPQQQLGCAEIEPVVVQVAAHCPAAPFINQLESQLRGTPGLDLVLAALIAHAQQNAAAGSKLGPGALVPQSSKAELLEVSCMSAVQEHHSSARALPLLIRLYFNTGSRAETIAAGKPEPLTAKLLERSLAVLAAKPVVPGCADVPVCLTSGLQACQGLSELAAARKLKLPTELGKLDFKAAFKLDQSCSLQGKVLPLLQQHDELCDLLSQLALEIQQAVAVERDIDPKALDNAEQLVSGSISFAAAARNSLLDLDAWRLSTCGAGTESATPTSVYTQSELCLNGRASDLDSTCDRYIRYKLKDNDVVAFMNVLGAVKGLTGLLSESSSWLQPLLQEHAVKQLNDFAFSTLPALSKVYARNPRLQDLLRAIYACIQGQFVEVGEDVDAPAAMPSPPAAAAEAALAAAGSEFQLQQQGGRPLAEGFEGLKGRWGSFKGSARKQAAADAAAGQAAAAVAALEAAQTAAAAHHSEEQPASAAHAGTMEDGAVFAAAAADVEAAAAAAAAATEAFSRSSSPCSVTHVEVEEAVQLQAPAPLQQEVDAAAQASPGAVSFDTCLTAAEAAAAACPDGRPPAEEPAAAAEQAPASEEALQPVAASASQPSRKRTFKGMFKLKASGRKKDKAAAQPAQEEATAGVAAAGDLAVSCGGASAAAAYSTAASAGGDCQSEEAVAVQLAEQQQGEQSGSAQPGRRPAPSSAYAWTDSENDMLLCHIRPQEVVTVPSAASSMTDLNSAGFERPPDLPFELQGATVGSDNSPRSVARAAAMFERIAAVNRQLAAASDRGLSNIGRMVAGGSKSSPGGWEAPASSTALPARLSEVAGSPLNREQLLEAAGADAEQFPGEQGVEDNPLAGSASQEHADSVASPAKAAKRRQGLFGLRSLLPSRTSDAPQQDSIPEPVQDAAAAADKQLAAAQQEKEQLAEQLQGKQEPVVLLSGQELEGLQSCPADAAIPASWGQAPVSPLGKQRMKGMLSMLRRGGARTASAGAAAALLGDVSTPATADAAAAILSADEQLAELSAAVAAAEYGGADAITAGADVAAEGSQCGSQPDASEDFDEDQPSKTRRVMGLMNRIRVFTQGTKEQQPAVQQVPQQQAGDAAGNRQGLKGLKFTAKLKKAMGDRRQSRFADVVGVDGQTQLPLVAMPSAACLQLLRVLLELLMQEIKSETKKHLMMQLQMAAAAAAGSAGVKPDASIARPLKQVKQMIKAVHRMQLMVDFPKQLLAAADVSDLWVGACCGSNLASIAVAAAATQQQEASPAPAAAGGNSSSGPWQSARSVSKPGGEGGVKLSVDLSPPSPKGLHPWSLYNLLFEESSENSLGEGVRNSLGALSLSKVNNRGAAEAAAGRPDTGLQDAGAADENCSQGHDSCSPWVVPQLSSFPSALITACMQHLEQMPAELPLLALQVLWDARQLLNSCGLLQQGLVLLQEQEKLCMCIYMQHLVPTAYEHFKRIAGHQTMRVELLQSCKAAPLQPVKQLYLDSLLREACPLVVQGDYAAVAAEAAATLRPGQLAAADAQLAETLTELGDAVQELQQRSAVRELQRAVDDLQQAEQGEQQAADGQQHGFDPQELPVSDQHDPAGGVRFSGVFTAAKPSPGKAPVLVAAEGSPSPGPASRSGRKKRQGRASSKQRSSAAGLPGQKGTSPGPYSLDAQQAAGITPLMQKLEGMQLEHEAYAAAGRYREWTCLQAWGASKLDVRQWLLAGMLQSLQQDAAVVVARCRCERPTAIVESQQHAAILRRTHELLSQYTPLPQSWEQIWQEADSQQATEDAGNDSSSTSAAAACVAGLLNMLNMAVYDAEAQVLLPAATSVAAAVPAVTGVLSEVERAVQPLAAFFGRQHLTALHVLAGPAGVQQLVAGVLDKLEQEQALLLEELLSLQQQLPPSLLQLPSAEDHHSAGAVLQFYQQQLSSALQDHAACAAALGSLQRIGNCLALLHLLSIQQAVWATPQFMQVAPLLGIVGRPMVDAAAAAECFEGEELPEPPSALASAAAVSSGCHNLAKACTPGLLMPEVETLLPSDHARHTHEMQALKELHQEDVCRWEARQAGQPLDNTLVKPGGELARHRVWQASHFQRLLLGPDAEKVRGPAMLLTQTAELRAWRATQGVDVLGPCLQRVQEWAVQLQQQLQGERDARRHKGSRRAGRSHRRKAAAAEGSIPEGSRKSSRSEHRLRQEGEQAVDLNPAQQAAALRSAADSRAAAAAAIKALSAETSAGPSAELSGSTLGPMTDPAGDGDLTDVEQQLQVLQAQVNAALIAAEERLRVVSMSPPSALLTEERPRVQLPPQPIPFNLEQGAAGLQLQGSGDDVDHPAAVLEAEDSVEQASPRAGTFSGVEAAASQASCDPASSTGTAATDPAFLTEQELSAAAEAAAAAARLPSNPWDAAGSAAAELPPGSVPPAQAKLAYKLLTQSTTTSPVQEGAEAAVPAQQQDEDEAGLGPSSARTGLAELVGELSDVGSLGSRPATDRSGYKEAHMPDQFQARPASCPGQAPGVEPSSTEKAAAGDSPPSAALSSPRRGVFVSCPGRCENGEDDAASECDTQSPRSPWQQQCIPSPARSPSPQLSPGRHNRMCGVEGSYLMANAVAEEQQWEDRSQQESPLRYPTPPITELLYETTCDELVRVKDERDMLMSEVEVLRNQLKNRDNTLAMLSGQMLITPRTSAADCESLMRAAMSECSVGSMAMRSQPAVSGAASQHGNTVSMGASTNGTQALRGAASAHQLGSDGSEAATASASAARTPQSARSARQQQQLGRRRSAVQADELQACHTGATVSAEASEVRPEHSKSSVRVQQATPCAEIVSTVGGGSATATADQSTCSQEDDEYLSSSCTDSDYSSCTDDELVGLAAVHGGLDSRAPCGASRKLKMPHTVKAARRASSSSSSSQDPSPWPPAQLAVALSALKFALLLDVASGADNTAEGPSQDARGSGCGAPAQSSPLRRMRKGVEGGDAAAGAAGVSQPAAAGTQQQQEVAAKQGASSRGSGRMTTALYGDGPLLASAVLLQLSGQARRFEVLDAAGRIAHWVEYDAVKASSSDSARTDSAAANDAAAAAAAGVTSPRGAGAASLAPSGVAAIVGAPGGIGPAAEGIAPPKPRSKKKQDEVAEALVREQAAAAAQQVLLERLAAAHRQALRVSRDGSSLAARFAPAAAARGQKVRLRVYRVDGAALQQAQRSAGGALTARSSSPGRITFGGGMGGLSVGAGTAGTAASASHSSGGSAEQPKVPAVPVRAATLQFYPRQQPWAGVRPTQRPIKTHSALPMARPQPLLLSSGPGGGPARPAGAGEGGFVPAAVANLPREAAAAAAAAAAAGTGIVGPSGKLLTGASVAPRAGLVAAARVMAAREVLLQAVPRNAAYSFSVVSDQNRSGRPEDGYSMAPSSADLDSLGPESPRRSPQRPSFMSAAMGASAARLGGWQRAAGPAGAEAGGTSMEQWLAGSAAAAGGGLNTSQDGSPSKASPTKRAAAAGQSGLLARAFG